MSVVVAVLIKLACIAAETKMDSQIENSISLAITAITAKVVEYYCYYLHITMIEAITAFTMMMIVPAVQLTTITAQVVAS